MHVLKKVHRKEEPALCSQDPPLVPSGPGHTDENSCPAPSPATCSQPAGVCDLPPLLLSLDVDRISPSLLFSALTRQSFSILFFILHTHWAFPEERHTTQTRTDAKPHSALSGPCSILSIPVAVVGPAPTSSPPSQ